MLVNPSSQWVHMKPSHVSLYQFKSLSWTVLLAVVRTQNVNAVTKSNPFYTVSNFKGFRGGAHSPPKKVSGHHLEGRCGESEDARHRCPNWLDKTNVGARNQRK